MEKEKVQAAEQAKVSARRKALELKARLEVRVNLERVDVEQVGRHQRFWWPTPAMNLLSF